MKRILFITIFVPAMVHAAVAPFALRCNLVRDPERTLVSYPALYFSWQVPGRTPADRQVGYQIQVDSTPGLTGTAHPDIWESGWISSDESVNVAYAGPPLASGQTCYWRVRIKTAHNRISPFSKAHSFTVVSGDSNRFERENRDWRDRSPLCQSRLLPQRIVKKGEGHYFLDFGKAAFATLAFPKYLPTSGTMVVHLGEVLASTDSLHRQPGGSRRYRKVICDLSAMNGAILDIPPDQRNTSGSAVLVPPPLPEVLPFRYVELENVPAPLKPEQIAQLTLHYPFDEDAADFSSSSTILNDIWALCKYSIKATSFLGVYVDGDRERIPYEGDAYINQLSHYAVDAEYAMPRHSIQYLFHHPTWPVEWQQHMILMAWADYMYTGQSDMLAKYYNDLAAKTLLALARADGLIVEDRSLMSDDFLHSLRLTQPPRVLVDWPPADFTKNNRYGERDGYDMKPVNSVANAFHYQTLLLMSRIANALHKDNDAKVWQERAGRVRRAFNSVFFDAERGYYIDAEASDHSALHANFFPLAFGLVDEEHMASVVRFIKSRGMACSVYGAQHLLDALYLAGEADYALALLTATHDRSWAHMIYDMNSTITTEAWDNKYKENQDWNHAWGAAPGNIVSRRLMGIEPAAPGFKVVRIHPQLGSLSQARMAVPTLRGTVYVHVQQDAKLWQAWIDIPAQMSAEIVLPAREISQILENGRKLASDRVVHPEHGSLVVPVACGHFHYRVARNN